MRRRRTAAFRRDDSSVPEARAWLTGCIRDLRPPVPSEVLDSALLGLSEIATNSIVHGAGTFFLLACTADEKTVCVECLDGGAKGAVLPAVAAAPSDDAESGRGLLIVEAISAGNWSWDTRVAGRMRVSFTLARASG